MEFLEVALKQIETHWALIVAIFSVIFFLYKIRAEETLRTKLKLINECYLSLALINDAIQDWSSLIIQTTVEDHDRQLMERIQKEMYEAHKYFHQASVLMRPETARSIRKIFVLLGLLKAEYTNWQIFKNNGRGFEPQALKAFENSKKRIPAEIQKNLHDVLTDFHTLVNGAAKITWWKISRPTYSCFRNMMHHDLSKKFEEDRKELLGWLK